MKNRTIRSAIYNQCGKMYRQVGLADYNIIYKGHDCVKVTVKAMKNYVDSIYMSEKDVYFRKNIFGFWKRVF